jgi:hypothetical protein
MGRKIKNKTGWRLGYLNVIELAGMKDGRTTWRCVCDCGREVILRTSNIRNDKARSCGCQDGVRRTLKFARMMLKIFRHSHEKGQLRRKHAQDRPFELTAEDIERLIFSDCHYCGVPPSNARRLKGYREYAWNGIDRVDNAKGYTPENTVACCKTCNYAKNKMSVDEFLGWLERIAIHQTALGNISLREAE